MFGVVTSAISAFHLVAIPYDRGANTRGSMHAPAYLASRFGKPESIRFVNGDDELDVVLDNGYDAVRDALESSEPVVVLGGDHTISISSVAAVNDFCLMRNETLGVLWADAHADFNTEATSPTQNTHGMPVAALCGHAMVDVCRTSSPLSPSQFAYYGVRDVDSVELLRMSQHNMLCLDSVSQIEGWCTMFDRIHLSFDIDCLDAWMVSSCVNTPVNDGKSLEDVTAVFGALRRSNKMISMDFVELNPEHIREAHRVIIDRFVRLVSTLLLR